MAARPVILGRGARRLWFCCTTQPLPAPPLSPCCLVCGYHHPPEGGVPAGHERAAVPASLLLLILFKTSPGRLGSVVRALGPGASVAAPQPLPTTHGMGGCPRGCAVHGLHTVQKWGLRAPAQAGRQQEAASRGRGGALGSFPSPTPRKAGCGGGGGAGFPGRFLVSRGPLVGGGLCLDRLLGEDQEGPGFPNCRWGRGVGDEVDQRRAGRPPSAWRPWVSGRSTGRRQGGRAGGRECLVVGKPDHTGIS